MAVTSDRSLCPGRSPGTIRGAAAGGEEASRAESQKTNLSAGTPDAPPLYESPARMQARITELEAQIMAVRAALTRGEGAGGISEPLRTAPSVTSYIREPSPAAAGHHATAGTPPGISVNDTEGDPRADDSQLTVGDEPGRSVFYGSASSRYLLVRIQVRFVTH